MPQVGFIALQGMMDTEWPLDARPPHTPIPTPALQSSVVGGAIGGAHLEMEPPRGLQAAHPRTLSIK
jgi:hypothetical protein